MNKYIACNADELLTHRIYEELPESTMCRRDAFQRDRDRIIHSRAFRRMMHKTQVFNPNKGDHYRNRLTHTLEVSQIARSIGKVLELNDELIEAIALGHDLGHTPFGHVGERTLDEILWQGILEANIEPIKENFKHNFQSLEVIDHLETRCSEYTGINLTLAVREGIIKHTKVTKNQGKDFIVYKDLNMEGIDLRLPSFTVEGQVVAIADEIAQCTHDLEDGVRSGIIEFSPLINMPLVQECINKYKVKVNPAASSLAYETRSQIIKNLVGFLIEDVCQKSCKNILNCTKSLEEFRKSPVPLIEFSDNIKSMEEELMKWMRDKIIFSEEISIADAKARYFIRHIFRAFFEHPLELPDYVLSKYLCGYNKVSTYSRSKIDIGRLQDDPAFRRTIANHIAGMTDQYAARLYKKLYYPDYV